MTQFADNFDRADSATPGGSWTNVGSPDLHIVSNKLSSSNNTAAARAANQALHGLTLTSQMQLDADIFAALDVNEGGVGFYIVNSATVNGYLFFFGNAVHIYKVTAGALGAALTNDGRPGDSGGGALANHVQVTWTPSGTNNLKVYLDGVLWSFATETTYANLGDAIIAQAYDDDPANPSREATIDNLVLKDVIGNPITTAVNRRRRRQLSARGLYIR